jgi:hypothetical protein
MVTRIVPTPAQLADAAVEVIPLPGGEGADEQPDGEHHQEHAHGHLRTPGREAVTGPSPATFSVIPAGAPSRKARRAVSKTTYADIPVQLCVEPGQGRSDFLKFGHVLPIRSGVGFEGDI